MDRFKTEINAGLNLFNDDLAFIDASIRDSFVGIISAWGVAPTDSFRISGCSIAVNGNIYSWTDGYIALNGEILKVVAGSVTLPNLLQYGYGVYWKLSISNDPSGYVRQSQDTYELRRGVLYYGDINTNPNYMPWNALYLKDKVLNSLTGTDLINKINLAAEGWQTPLLLNSWVNYANGGEPCGYNKDITGTIFLKGWAYANGSNTTAIFNLPTGYRPVNDRHFLGNTIKIDSSGNVFLTNASTALAYLDGISFKI